MVCRLMNGYCSFGLEYKQKLEIINILLMSMEIGMIVICNHQEENINKHPSKEETQFLIYIWFINLISLSILNKS
jgi:hypothetical protein